MSDGEAFVRAVDRELEAAYEEPMSIEAYVDRVLERPTVASHASKYLLEAIESMGTRHVIEEGEETERYRFFDDPHNDGEHAILGNTEILNAFVDDLRTIAAGRGKNEKILWFDGPTATGKSELKRCLINGLREYSKTDAGRRYTLEWNVASGSDASSGRGLAYGENPQRAADVEENWYESPVQVHPLSVFPESVRGEVLSAVNESAAADGVSIRVDERLDPFSREAYDVLAERYRRAGEQELFSAITDTTHLRVKNYVVDVGQGIGVLHSEDDGTPKERLVGSWMRGMLQELDSRGRKNPQAFSYDGVLSQGNGLLTVVEDAAQHADLLQKLLNVPDEGAVKLDKGIGMDVDTQLVVISNPDLEATLNQHADREGMDPLKALKRRLDKHEFTYLTNLSLETELIRRELTGETEVWTVRTYDELAERIREPVALSVKTGAGSVATREYAPHTIEAAALYAVVTRLADDVPDDLDLVDKAMLYDRGYLQDGDTRLEMDDFEFGDEQSDGTHGIPVTYTRDVLADLLHTDRDRHHPEFDVASVVMPRDVLDEMVDGLRDAPVFSEGERAEFESRVAAVQNHVFDAQETDVLDAMMHDRRVDESTVEEYVEHVYAWETEDPITNDRGERVDPDPLLMKVFEVEHLGRFDEAEYGAGGEPSDAVASFRRENVITALNRFAWEQRGDDFRVADVELTAIPIIQTVLESNDWDDVRRRHEDFDPKQWEDPPSGTETARVKDRTVEALVDHYGYSRASAELTSRHVMNQVAYQWD